MSRRRREPIPYLEREVKKHIEQGQPGLELEVKHINDEIGKGLFTKKTFEHGEVIVLYKGDVLEMPEACQREVTYKDNAHNYLFYFEMNRKKMCIDATPYPEEYGRYANDQHEKFATAQVKRVLVDQIPYLAIVAKKKLYPGMEVTYDYGDKKAPWRVKASKKGAILN